MNYQLKSFFMEQSVFVASVKSNIDLPKRALENVANKYKGYNRSRTDEDFVLSGFENNSWRFHNFEGAAMWN